MCALVCGWAISALHWLTRLLNWTMCVWLFAVSGGLEMSLVVGIDYTASNGPPMDPRSLHFIDPRGPNQVRRRGMLW